MMALPYPLADNLASPSLSEKMVQGFATLTK